MGATLSQPAGIVAAEEMTQAAPDSYTILAGSISQIGQKILRPEAKFDPIAGFVPIIQTSTTPTVLIVPAESPVKSVKVQLTGVKAD